MEQSIVVLINDYLDSIEEKLFELELTKKVIDYIGRTDANYFKPVVEKSRFLYSCWKNAIKVFVIDLCKIVEQREYRNIGSLLDALSIHQKELVWKYPFAQHKLDSMKQALEEIRSSSSYLKIKTLRDKYYAHSDKDKLKYETKWSKSEIWEMVDSLQEMYNQINLSLRETKIMFGRTQQYSELQMIYKYSKISQYAYEKCSIEPDDKHIQVIIEILRKKSV